MERHCHDHSCYLLAVQITHTRLATKVSREKMIDMLASYNVSLPKGTLTADLAYALAEQLHYKTASSAEEDDEKDDEEDDEEDGL